MADNTSQVLMVLCIAVGLIFVILGFLWGAWRIRKGGGGTTTTILGATDGLMSNDTRAASETIVEVNAGNKAEEQDSEGSKDKTDHSTRFTLPDE